MTLLFAVAGVLAGVVLVSFLIESLRPRPEAPNTLYWDPTLKVQYASLAGHRLRFVRGGQGPHLVLLHTLRTQLDIFEKLAPRLARRYTIHALDYPGHGFSEIPKADSTPELFVAAVEAYLEHAEIRDVTLLGVSIGGTTPLLIAAKGNPRVRKVVAINPYDYARGRGVTRANFVAWLVMSLARVPIVGETVMRLRLPLVERWVMEGGVTDKAALSPQLLAQLVASGARPGHYQAFLNLIRHAQLWDEAHAVYDRIEIPVLLIYGERDWSHSGERARTAREIPGAKLQTVAGGGHFLPLDQPERLARLIEDFV